jgi:hypothetical protein
VVRARSVAVAAVVLADGSSQSQPLKYAPLRTRTTLLVHTEFVQLLTLLVFWV